MSERQLIKYSVKYNDLRIYYLQMVHSTKSVLKIFLVLYNKSTFGYVTENIYQLINYRPHFLLRLRT